VLRDKNGVSGSVLELNAKGEVIWRIDSLQQPVDAAVVGTDRVLIAEQHSHQVTERDFSGKVHWRMQVMMPVGVQVLPNGHTFVTARNQLLELDEKHNPVFDHKRAPADINAAQKLRSGEVVFLTNAGLCIRLDAQGKVVKEFPTVRMYYDLGQVEVLSNARILLTQRDEVAEYTADGHKEWSAAYSWPSSAQRLPNGNTLVASTRTERVAELDRKGQSVWEYRPEAGRVPCRAKRR
jgi:hypothetical protein